MCCDKSHWPSTGSTQLPPLEADKNKLDEYNTFEILRLEKGIAKGLWAEFEAIKWLRTIPDGVPRLRRILLYAEDQGNRDTQTKEPPLRRGEGCYSTVWGDSVVAVKVYEGKKSLESFRLKACELAIKHAEIPIYGYGTIKRYKGAPLIAPSIGLVMHTLQEITAYSTVRFSTFLQQLEKLSQSIFHNDLKRDNVMQWNGHPRLIDFDLGDPTKIRVAVSAGSTIDFDFEPHGLAIPTFRTYYDLFYFSLSISAEHPWWLDIIEKLRELFGELKPLFENLLKNVSSEKLHEIPLEVLVREESITGTTCHLLDLRGMVMAHSIEDGEQVSGADDFPTLIKSRGIY